MIFFDIDDTLLDNHGAEFSAAKDFQIFYKDTFPISVDEFALNWRIITDKYIQRFQTGELTFQAQRRERIKELFIHDFILSDEEADNIFQKYLTCYENNWRLFPDVLSTLEYFAEYNLGIISNGDSVQQRQKLTSTGIIDRFSVLMISSDIGVMKPDPQIFIEACSVAGVEPSECWHIGDNLEVDLNGSLSVGMKGIWLNRNGDNPIHDIMSIKFLSEIKSIIEAHN